MKLGSILGLISYIAFISYMLVMPYAALFGTSALGDNAMDEWFVIMGVVSVTYLLYAFIKGRSK